MKCVNCESMWCKEFHAKKELWTGYCPRLRQKDYGNDKCRLVEEQDLFTNKTN
jgi:hypothetical protein